MRTLVTLGKLLGVIPLSIGLPLVGLGVGISTLCVIVGSKIDRKSPHEDLERYANQLDNEEAP